MIVQKVISNLNNTINGKVLLLANLESDYAVCSFGESLALEATVKFLKINIEELTRIRDDLTLVNGEKDD